MFHDKESFKLEYEETLVKTEGVLLQEASLRNKYSALVCCLREIMLSNQVSANQVEKNCKQVYYFSMEFLIGKLLNYYLVNFGLEEIVRDGLAELNIDLAEVLLQENDPGLGNGGLGRLAACYLDSMAFWGIKGHGNCIRYKYGMFEQRILTGYQHEVADNWLRDGFPWETRKPDKVIIVKFKGNVRMEMINEKPKYWHENFQSVLAVPYDVPVMSYQNPTTVNNLRLWSAEPAASELDLESFNKGNFQQSIASGSEIEAISYVLYPDDSSQAGKELRLKQEYFFVAAGLGSLVRTYKKKRLPWHDFAQWNAIHINDTHPTLCIPELMRIFIDEEGLDWDEAWRISVNSISFTNHTIMPEALEIWPIEMFSNLLPRIFMIVAEIERRFLESLQTRFPNEDALSQGTRILKNGQVVMANLAVIGSSSVNGVAALHTDILKHELFKDFYRVFSYKFNNKTNGVNHRRFLLAANPTLSRLLTDALGPGWIKNANDLKKLRSFEQNTSFLEKLADVKYQNKVHLLKWITEKQEVSLDPHSIFDVHVKRMHAYKRQLLNVLKIMYLYNQVYENPASFKESYTFIFGGKAAPGYHYAKTVIKLINSLARKIRKDPLASQWLQIVFLENFNVTVGELVYPAADVSEQISTLSKEVSGTGNMKFMFNGAVTLGTMDGANVEIQEAVGKQNMFVFGLTSDEVINFTRQRNYRSWDVYHSNSVLRQCVDQLINGFFNEDAGEEFRIIYDSLLVYNDEYFVLKDFASYIEAFSNLTDVYHERSTWNRMALVNIEEAGRFSSDRAIEEYAREIWKAKMNNPHPTR